MDEVVSAGLGQLFSHAVRGSSPDIHNIGRDVSSQHRYQDSPSALFEVDGQTSQGVPHVFAGKDALSIVLFASRPLIAPMYFIANIYSTDTFE